VLGGYSIKHYGLVMYIFRSKLMCLTKQAEVTDNSSKTLAYYSISSLTAHYKSVMFYSIGTSSGANITKLFTAVIYGSA
jgi:hypothetical protein